MIFKKILLGLGFLFFLACSRGGAPVSNLAEVRGELAAVKSQRALSDEDLRSSVKTYVPSGKLDDHLAFFGTGISGRLAVVGLPSMRVLKYVAVFSSEPWQGFAFDDQSKSLIFNSARDEIEYDFGDIGRPAVSLTDGKQDARSVFAADGANGRIALVDLLEYEVKQIFTHPIFDNSNPDLVVTSSTEYVVQSTQSPNQIFINSVQQPKSGVTFWKFKEKEVEQAKHYYIEPQESFSVLLPPHLVSSPVAGLEDLSPYVFFLSTCSDAFETTGKCESSQSNLHVLDWGLAARSTAEKAKTVKNHAVFDYEAALAAKIVKTYPLPFQAHSLAVSQNGQHIALLDAAGKKIHIASTDLKAEGGVEILKTFDLEGVPVDAQFAQNTLLVSATEKNQVIKIDLEKLEVLSRLDLKSRPGSITVPMADSTAPHESLAVVANHEPHKTYKRLGPNMGLGATLVEFEGDLKAIYQASVPMTTQLSGVAISTQINKPIFKYRIGTDPRSGELSYYKTNAGKERIVRNGKRVHVFATVIRSHITPDSIEVEQDDVVSIHITSQEQSKDQTHGFTIDTYNVHGSWEPGKTASVTFVADRPGVFPFYCTEFCSALHLEMQGYLLVKPKQESWASPSDNLTELRRSKQMNDFFGYIKGESL